MLAARPAEQESQISFAGVADLLAGVLDEVLAGLPDPQRRALEVALLLAGPRGSPPEQGAIAFAFLGCLRMLSRESPVLLAVDDVQWLDSASSLVLTYASRRLDTQPIAVLVAQRTDGATTVPLGLDSSFAGRLERLQLGPLTLGALHRVLHERLGVTFPRPTLRRIHEGSNGNPFYALELARALQREGRAHGEIPLPPTLDELVAERVEALSQPARLLLLAASALGDAGVGTLEQTELVDNVPAALDEAATANIVEIRGDRVRFTHPLLAAAISAHAGDGDRRTVRRRLAELAETAEERARHLALSASAPSAELARQLDEGAREARSRGAPSAAAELLEHAIRLSPPEDALLGWRRYELADALYTAGDAERARTLLHSLAEDLPPGHARARALWRLATVEGELVGSAVEIELYEQALEEARGDVELTTRVEIGLARMRIYGGANEEAIAHASRARQLAEGLGDPEVLALALAVFVEANRYAGRDVPREEIERAVELEAGLARPPSVSSPSSIYSLELRANLELDRAREVLERHLEQVEAVGDETAEPMVLFRLFDTELLAGRWERAEWCAQRMTELAEPSGVSREYARLAQALVDAYRGRIDSAHRAAEAGLAFAEETGELPLAHHHLALLGFLALSCGDSAEAAERLIRWEEVVRGLGYRDPYHLLRGAVNEAEALIEVDRLEEAERSIDWFEEAAREAGREWPFTLSTRSRALLLAARGDLEAALAQLEAVPEAVPFERARTLLVLGIVRRRAKRRRQAREALEQALAAFEQLGSPLWSEKARAELGRIGGRTPAGQELTVAEQRIAELVAGGKTNKEVAAELFVSVHTVEKALTRVYGKLGIRSRTELARKL